MLGRSEFVDEFLKSSSIRWNQQFTKSLCRYCREMLSSTDIDETILDINFPEDGLKLSWRGSDILKYAFEIKHYQKSSKNNQRVQGLAREEANNETLTIVSAYTSFVIREEEESLHATLPLVLSNANVEESLTVLEGLGSRPLDANVEKNLASKGLGPRKRRNREEGAPTDVATRGLGTRRRRIPMKLKDS